MIGIIGLGRMGSQLALNLDEKGYQVVGYDLKKLPNYPIKQCDSLKELINTIEPPRTIILMLPAGVITNQMISQLMELLKFDDTILDFSNSYYENSQANYKVCKEVGINYLDCGISGGIDGARKGGCISIGGDREVFLENETLFKDISTKNGYCYLGISGSGHYVKMVHNGIEYGLLQSYAEGFSLLEKSEFELDLQNIAKLWNSGSIIRSYILELIHEILGNIDEVANLSNEIDYNFSGNWTIQEALNKGVPTPAIYAAVNTRLDSKAFDQLSNRLVSALRFRFGGHEIFKQKQGEEGEE